MRYCPDCGTSHECIAEEAKTERDAIDREVEITRLNTRRDIEVARINASAARDISETEAESEVARAEGVVEGVETTLDAVTGGDDAPAPDPEPVIIDAPEAIADSAPDDAPPETDETEGSAPPAAAPKKLGIGAW
jgi:hypothetical protein